MAIVWRIIFVILQRNLLSAVSRWGQIVLFRLAIHGTGLPTHDLDNGWTIPLLSVCVRALFDPSWWSDAQLHSHFRTESIHYHWYTHYRDTHSIIGTCSFHEWISITFIPAVTKCEEWRSGCWWKNCPARKSTPVEMYVLKCTAYSNEINDSNFTDSIGYQPKSFMREHECWWQEHFPIHRFTDSPKSNVKAPLLIKEEKWCP